MWLLGRAGGRQICQKLLNLKDFHLLASPRLIQRSVWNEATKDDFLNFYDSTVEDYAKQPIEQLTLTHLLDAGKDAWYDPSRTLEHARFTHDELPKRLARRLMDLQLLPHIVVTNPFINQVYRAYYHAFNTLRTTAPPRDMKENEAFVALLRRLVDEHAPMLDALAAGLRECRKKPIVGQQLRLDAFLENMLRSRISRRVLAEQHININHARPNYIGVICTNLDMADSVDFAAGRCRQVCTETFGMAPDIVITGGSNVDISYIPAHIDYMLYELLKNAARAVVERHHRVHTSHYLSYSPTATAPPRLPPIHVRLCGGEDSVSVRVSDEGGGIPVEQVDKVWEFGWTTIDQKQRNESSGSENNGGHMAEGLGSDNQLRSSGSGWVGTELGGPAGQVGRFRMAGLGFGLPLSRLYARYFGGDLQLVTIPGYGVDVFLSLKRLDGDAWGESCIEENTPVMGVAGGEQADTAAPIGI